MNTTTKRDGGRDGENTLSSDLVLVVNPRSTTTGGGLGGPPAAGQPSVLATTDGTIAISTLRDEERELLALVNGSRSVAELIRLSTLSEQMGQKHLRALLNRGILVQAAEGAVAAPAAGSGSGPKSGPTSEFLATTLVTDDDTGFSTDGPSGLTKAIDEYLELAATALSGPAVSGEKTTPGGLATPIAVPVLAPGPPVAAFRPNVTVFWTPSMTTAVAAETSQVGQRDAAQPTGAKTASAEGAAPAGAAAAPASGPTVVVTGSPGPADANSGKAKGVPGPGPGLSEAVPKAAVVPPVVKAPVPFRVGGYEVATRIAQGGMGSIYVCRRVGDTSSQRLYTLKVVRQHSTQREEAIRSFKREADVGARLSHPNLQTVRDVGSYRDQPFLILDYVEGSTLSELISGDRRAPVPIVVSILLDVLRGLQAAHSLVDEARQPLELVHGDISPQNVLVGIDGMARLTDFGSAIFANEGVARDSRPIATGKPAHMAPEQLRAEAVDARTDVFCIGVLMWNALTGQKLFAAETYDEVIIKVLRKKIPPPSTFGSPAFLDEICLRALSRSRDGRYASADNMARDLLRIASDHKVLASLTEVGHWVRQESGEALGEQRRRIQVMFAGANPSRGRVNTPLASRPTAATMVLDNQDPLQTPPLGATKSLPSRTVFLPSGPPRRTFWRTWNVAIVSALLALPVTLTIGYFVSNFLLYRSRPSPPRPAVSTVDAGLSP